MGVSPDGSNVFYSAGAGGYYGARAIWLMGPHGESPHKVLTAGDNAGFGRMEWSPAGNRIAYNRVHKEGNQAADSVESCDLSGANKTTILSNESGGAFL
jgi:Tol biopolymer transport system component